MIKETHFYSFFYSIFQFHKIMYISAIFCRTVFLNCMTGVQHFLYPSTTFWQSFAVILAHSSSQNWPNWVRVFGSFAQKHLFRSAPQSSDCSSKGWTLLTLSHFVIVAAFLAHCPFWRTICAEASLPGRCLEILLQYFPHNFCFLIFHSQIIMLPSPCLANTGRMIHFFSPNGHHDQTLPFELHQTAEHFSKISRCFSDLHLESGFLCCLWSKDFFHLNSQYMFHYVLDNDSPTIFS